MKISATTLAGDTFELDVADDLELENFKAFCEMESGIPSAQIIVTLDGRDLVDDKLSLKDHGIKNGDLVLLKQVRQAATAQSTAPGNRKYIFLTYSLPAEENFMPVTEK